MPQVIIEKSTKHVRLYTPFGIVADEATAENHVNHEIDHCIDPNAGIIQ